jgi:hypothetical protein
MRPRRIEDLIWLGQEPRLARFRAAVELARRDPPYLLKGDLAADLEPLIATAPRDATPVVFHSAVLAYAALAERQRLVAAAGRSGARWFSNDALSVFPAIAATAPAPAGGRFLLALDGKPLALDRSARQSLDWLASP